jgi:mono/diheme cytochrome c family protein
VGLGLLGVCGFWWLGCSWSSRALSAEPAKARTRAAAKLFRRYCVQCHGKDGRGGPGRRTLPTIPNFTNPSWQKSRTNPQLAISILDGKNKEMPNNQGRLTTKQIADLVAYIRTFGPAPTPRAGQGRQTKRTGEDPFTQPDLTGSTDFDAAFNKLQHQWDDLNRQSQKLVREVARDVAKESPRPTTARTHPPQRHTNPNLGPRPARFFRQNCTRCHTIGGGARTGPDLKHVNRRKDRDWLVRFLRNPKAVIDRGDPYALRLQAAARGLIMPHTFGITRGRAEDLLDFIAAESRRKKSQFAVQPLPDRPYTPGDAERGRELFAGRLPLANGGPACIACHTIHGSGPSEGGRLGPDLTKAFERVGGRNALTARLWASGNPTMLPVYQRHPLEKEEALALAAYLEETAKEGVEDAASFPLNFFLMGLGGAVLGLAAINFFWGKGLRPAKPTGARRKPCRGPAGRE